MIQVMKKKKRNKIRIIKKMRIVIKNKRFIIKVIENMLQNIKKLLMNKMKR